MPAINKKLLFLLKSFSDKELKEFKKLVSSPLYTERKNYVYIVNELVKMTGRDSRKFSLQEFYSKIYPGKRFSPQTVKNRLSELFKLAEEFLIYRNLNKRVIEKEKILLNEYLENKMISLFESKYKKTRRQLESLPDSEDKFRNISFLNGVNLSLLNQKTKLEKMYKQHYEHSIYSVCVFLIEIFEKGIDFIKQEYNGRKIESNVIVEMLKGLKIEELMISFRKSHLKICRVTGMHYYLYKAFENPNDEKNYFNAKKMFSEDINFFSSEYKDKIYKLMVEYCLIRQNSGIKNFQYELFDIYNEKLKQGLHSEFGAKEFPANSFRDYVFIGIELKKFKWVDSFITKYAKELPEEIRDDEVNLSHAKLHFALKNFDKTILFLNKIKGLNYLHYTDASVLKMCCHYENNRIEESFYEIDKFKHYLRNHKEIPDIHKEPNLNFVKIYQMLVSNKSKTNCNDLGFLKEKIVSLRFISKGAWLVEKVS